MISHRVFKISDVIKIQMALPATVIVNYKLQYNPLKHEVEELYIDPTELQEQ